MVERASLEKLTGTVLGTYRLEKLVERSKWGPVFLASTETGAGYVIRFVDVPSQKARSEQAADAKDAHIVFLGRFQREANLIAALQHPHILPLLDYGNYQGAPYLVYPNVPLTSLRALLAQSVPTDLASIGRYLDQIASALEYAHQHAVIHRNLSTACIFMQANGQMVVTEFGLMRIHELSRQDSLPAHNSPIDGGSESSAPEQLLGKPVDVYTDIYGLGVILYRLLTGHPPFAGKTREEIAQQHLYAEVPPLKTWRSELPVELDRIIMKAMAKEPLQRYRQPIAFADAYRRSVAPSAPLLTPQPVAQPPAPVLLKESAPIKKSTPVVSRRHVFPLLAGGAIVVGGVAFAGIKILGSSSTVATTSKAGGNTPVAASKGAASGGTVIGRTSTLAANSATTFPIANQANPGVLIHLPDNRFVAFDSTCTHAGCGVSYDPQKSLLHCPCHEALFDPAKNAAVVRGPAQTPLAPIKISVHADGTITT